jgi:hypothetical protein
VTCCGLRRRVRGPAGRVSGAAGRQRSHHGANHHSRRVRKEVVAGVARDAPPTSAGKVRRSWTIPARTVGSPAALVCSTTSRSHSRRKVRWCHVRSQIWVEWGRRPRRSSTPTATTRSASLVDPLRRPRPGPRPAGRVGPGPRPGRPHRPGRCGGGPVADRAAAPRPVGAGRLEAPELHASRPPISAGPITT